MSYIKKLVSRNKSATQEFRKKGKRERQKPG